MANRLGEVMNRDVLSFEADAPARAALEAMLALGVTTAPVVDGRGHPLGVTSMKELTRAPAFAPLAHHLRSPAIVARPEMTLTEAARLLDEADLHHLVVVDGEGRLTGFASSLDLLRGLIGAPARHPDTFVHWDPEAGMAFSNERVLDPEHLDGAPHGPGLVVLTRGGAGKPERVTWVDVTPDIKGWLLENLARPEELSRRAGQPLRRGALRYRYAEIADRQLREEIAFRMREQAQHALNQDAG